MSKSGKTTLADDLEQRLRAREAECAALRAELDEARAVLEAIRHGDIDALLVAGPEESQVFTLEGAEHPYRIMVESMSDGAATLVADGTLAYANARLAVLLGVPLERLLGQRFVDFIVPLEHERFEMACAAARDEQRVEEFEIDIAEGDMLPARIALSPLRRSPHLPEAIPGLCLVVTDLTESQRNSELALAISKREAAEAELRLAVRQKDAFLAMLAHELRNPLAPIRHAAELLTRSVGNDAKAQNLLAIITRQTDQLIRLVDDLLDVARIAQSRIVLKKEPLEIGSLVDQALETVQPIVGERGHQLRVNKPSTPLYVHGDRARLAQSLSNLLHNAAKYTDPGGAITVAVTAAAEQLELEVRDTGIGITEYLLPQVFDLFVQSEQTLDRAQGGLGIGLSIVKGLIEMHGGTVKAASAGAGCGSTFTIRLPRITPPAEVLEQQSRSGSSVRRRVLVVDDNVDAADSLALLLKSDGHEAATAYSANSALEAVERLRPEIVLLDVGLPQRDGYEIARLLRASNTVPGMRLIALTGYGQEEDRERARAAGFDEHLLKPANMDALRQLLTP
jgi:PAS domain S-box-containing protein